MKKTLFLALSLILLVPSFTLAQPVEKPVPIGTGDNSGQQAQQKMYKTKQTHHPASQHVTTQHQNKKTPASVNKELKREDRQHIKAMTSTTHSHRKTTKPAPPQVKASPEQPKTPNHPPTLP